MHLDDFDYVLPRELIAQYPPLERTGSRLLHLDGRSGRRSDRLFRDLPELVSPGDLLVLNDTRVIKARLRGTKASGGGIEVLIERVLDMRHALAQIRASHPPREGSVLCLVGGVQATVLARQGALFRLRFEGEVFALLEQHGAIPLPPYIDRAPEPCDEERYQTVYARMPGAVAAPTAGLHFEPSLLAVLQARGVVFAWVTLHVGAGTFQPVRVANVHEHRMHSEWYEIPPATAAAIAAARARGGRVVAVGTTTLRALEAASPEGEVQAGHGETNLFILPGYRFRVVERLITNFHLPRSTLLMLVAAFGGQDAVFAAYRHAVRARYRFYSYGDAMLIDRAQP